MSFSGNFLFTFLRKLSGERDGKSNQKDKSFYDNVENINNVHDSKSASKNVDNHGTRFSTANSQILFIRNMKEKDIKIELFMIEGDNNFEILSLRSKMTQIIKRSNPYIKNWYYEMGIEGKLSNTYEDFKSKFIDFCSGHSIDNMTKYRDELWSDYLERLICLANERSIGEDEIFKKLRREYAPKTLQIIFYSFGITLKDVIERVLEWEMNITAQKITRKIDIKKTFI
ncbi:hypothetical protein DMUE_2706 [Dictyocoela muelleri]|nr:hypothetical protein DMUE_2706 [Dictyocoela muelleri]